MFLIKQMWVNNSHLFVCLLYILFTCSVFVLSFSAPSLQELLAVKMFPLYKSGMLNGKSDFSSRGKKKWIVSVVYLRCLCWYSVAKRTVANLLFWWQQAAQFQLSRSVWRYFHIPEQSMLHTHLPLCSYHCCSVDEQRFTRQSVWWCRTCQVWKWHQI